MTCGKFVSISQGTITTKAMQRIRPPGTTSSRMPFGLCIVMLLSLSGCGQTANPVTPGSKDLVDAYYSGPLSNFNSELIFDHSASQITASKADPTSGGLVPVTSGTFLTAPTGFLSITENFATPPSGSIAPQTPPLTGAWAVEIPGVGALANLLAISNAGGLPVVAAPAAMAENATCPDFYTAPANFLYVTVPQLPGAPTPTADYGTMEISTIGSAVTFKAQPYLLGPSALTRSVVTGGCSETYLGPLTAYPLNSFDQSSNLDLVAIGASGLLTSSFLPSSGGNTPSAFGGNSGVIGVATSSAPVSVSAVVSARYNGFLYAPQNPVNTDPLSNAPLTYDITVLASAFGDDSATSQACSTLQSSLAANLGPGAGKIPALPSANTVYGGEFLSTKSGNTVNDPTGANGSENCDVAIDLGTQDSNNNGLFSNATIFIGSNYPPFSASNPWICFGTTSICAVSFPAVAVVGSVEGQYVIFVESSATSTRMAQLPIANGSSNTQPVGIYLFQKSQ